MKKIAVFADVQNLYYTVRQVYGCHFDYSVLWAEVSRRGVIVEAYAYAIDRGDAKQQQFQQTLRKLGFTVKLKPYIQRSDGSAKGDWVSASPLTCSMPSSASTRSSWPPVTATSTCCSSACAVVASRPSPMARPG